MLGSYQLFINYIKYVYKSSATFLSFKGVSNELIHPTKCVQQGDPLSPLLFLIVLNGALQALPDYGIECEDGRVSHLVYADDLVFLADHKLQRLLNCLY